MKQRESDKSPVAEHHHVKDISHFCRCIKDRFTEIYQEDSGHFLLVSRLLFVSFWRRKGMISWLRKLVSPWIGVPVVEHIHPRELEWGQSVCCYSRVTGLPGMQLWDWGGKEVGHQGLDGFGGGCLSFLLLMEIRDFLSVANSWVPVMRHFTFTIPHLSCLLCHSVCHGVIHFHLSGRKLGKFPLADASFGASWRALILLYTCLQLTPHCPESVCPLGAWTSVHSGHKLCTEIHTEPLKSVFFTLDWGLQSQGIAGYQRTLYWTEKDVHRIGPEKFCCWKKNSRT